MFKYYFKRALEILCDEGPAELAKSTRNFAWGQVPFRYRIKYTKFISRVKYDVPIEPLRIRYINPERIEYSVEGFSHNRRIGTLEAGNWDKNRTRFSELTTYLGFYQRFVEGFDWENTEYYERARKNIEEEGEHHGYSTAESFLKNRCRYIDNLYISIKNDGYQPQATINEYNIDPIKHDNISNSIKQTHEIGCNIGRDGELLSNSGHHRLTIAKILDLEKIPIQIIVRHEKWQEIRDEIHNNGLPDGCEDLRDHPDLQDILD